MEFKVLPTLSKHDDELYPRTNGEQEFRDRGNPEEEREASEVVNERDNHSLSTCVNLQGETDNSKQQPSCIQYTICIICTGITISIFLGTSCLPHSTVFKTPSVHPCCLISRAASSQAGGFMLYLFQPRSNFCYLNGGSPLFSGGVTMCMHFCVSVSGCFGRCRKQGWIGRGG